MIDVSEFIYESFHNQDIDIVEELFHNIYLTYRHWFLYLSEKKDKDKYETEFFEMLKKVPINLTKEDVDVIVTKDLEKAKNFIFK